MAPTRFDRALLALLLVAAFLCGFNAIHDHDTWWNLAFGREIVTHRSLVGSEPFAFTRQGEPATNLSWLANSIMFLFYEAFGYYGLLILTGLAAAGTMLVLAKAAALQGAGLVPLAIYFSLFFRFFKSRFRPRPELFALLLFAILLYLLILYKRDLLKFKAAVPLIFLVWMQCHGSWTYGLALIPFFVLEKRGFSASRALFRDLFWLAALPVLALFINPHGYKTVLFPFTSFLTLRKNSGYAIQEWESMGMMAYTVPFLAMPALLLLHRIFLAARKEGSWLPVAYISLQWALILSWQRYNSFGFIALSFLAADSISRLAGKLPDLPGRLVRPLAMILLALPLSWSFTYRPHSEWIPLEYPDRESAFLLEAGTRANLLHTYEHGGYLEFATHPSCRTFFDGRYFDFLPYYREYMDARRGVDSFRDFVEKYPFTAAVLPYSFITARYPDGSSGVKRSGFAFILPKERWAPVFFGPCGAVFLKRVPENEEAIGKYEYRILFPNDEEHINSLIGSGRHDRKELDLEILRAARSGAGFAVEIR